MSSVPLQGAGGEQYNPGPPTPPRQAAAVVLLREGDGGPEVLLVRRTPKARFMGGVWVFPGGAVRGAAAEDEDEAHREAARRELREEAAVSLPSSDSLVPFARWITPARVQTRFDTHFFLARLPEGQSPEVDGEECVELGWFGPDEALAANREGVIALVFPTIKQLEELRPFDSVEELLARMRGRQIEPIEPRVLMEEGGEGRIVLPGEPGYEEA